MTELRIWMGCVCAVALYLSLCCVRQVTGGDFHHERQGQGQILYGTAFRSYRVCIFQSQGNCSSPTPWRFDPVLIVGSQPFRFKIDAELNLGDPAVRNPLIAAHLQADGWRYAFHPAEAGKLLLYVLLDGLKAYLLLVPLRWLWLLWRHNGA